MLRHISAALGSMAIVLAGLTFTAAPASAAEAITVSPTLVSPGATVSSFTVDMTGLATGTWSGGFPYQVRFNGFTSTANAALCTDIASVSSPGVGMTLPLPTKGASAAADCSLTNNVVSFHYEPSPSAEAIASRTLELNDYLVAPSAGAYTVDLLSGSGAVLSSFTVCVEACPVGVTAGAPPSITLDFDGNGGTCTPSSVTGDQGTWGTALTADQCTNGSRRLAFFSTSPTAGAGATNVRPGGPIYFLEANRLYAIWEFEKPSPVTDVVATSGLNSLKVTWKPPVSNGGDPINSYCIALRTETNANPFPRCVNSALPLEFTAALPATNSKYSFTVFARNAAGSSEPVASGPVSPYDIKGVTASRKDVLLGLGGTQVEARGDAPGLAGQTLNVEYKVGTGQWTTQANAVKVDAASKFRWSNKFPRSSNKNAVSVRFTYGSDAVVGPFVLNRGGEAGDLSAPRNIRVDNQVNKVTVTWDRPKFDGGATITGYTLCAAPGGGIGGRMCRSETGTEGTFWNLNTRQTYTFTVSAKTAKREGPRGTYAKPVDPTEASIRGAARSFDQLTADVRGEGFKKNSRFRVEMAIPVPGENPRTWNWDEVTSFKEGQDSFRNTLQIPLDASVRGERLILRLVTPTGTVSSRPIRP